MSRGEHAEIKKRQGWAEKRAALEDPEQTFPGTGRSAGMRFLKGTDKWRVLRPKQDALPFKGWEGISEGPAEVHQQAENLMSPNWGTGHTKPIEHVYRGMSHGEWASAQENGHVKSDGRGAIVPQWEGTNATVDPETADYYVRTTPHTETHGGVVAKIAVHPDEHWFTSSADNYVRTRHPIPMSRVLSVQFHGPQQ